MLDRLADVFEDLRRRRVFRAGGLYWVGSLAVLGALDLLRDLIPWLDTVFPTLVLTAVVVFPAVLVVSWIVDWTPEGIRLYRPGAGERSLGTVQRLWAVLVLSLSTFGFGWAVLLLWSRSEDVRARELTLAAEARDPARVAVLYFDDYSPAGDFDYLANGLTEGLISALGEVDALEVTSRNGVRPFRQVPVGSDSIARALDVGTLVLGSVTGEGDRVRVSAQLIDVTLGDRQLWSGQFESGESDILTLQSELVAEISTRLRERLGVVIRTREAALEASDDEAWLLVMEARELREQALAPDSPGGEYALDLLARAEARLGEARDRDPGWSAPLIDLGWVALDRSRLLSEAPGFVRAADSLLLVERADSAVHHSDAAPAALELRGVVLHELAQAAGLSERYLAQAEEDLRGAVTRDPGRALALATLADLRRLDGDFEEAATYARRALDADAFLEQAADVVYNLYQANLELKRWEEADRWCDRGRDRFRRDLRFVFCRIQFETLRPEVAPPPVLWALMDTLQAESGPGDWQTQYRAWGAFHVAAVLARNARPDSARAVMEAYGPSPELRPYLAYNEAHVHLLLGDRDAALRALEAFVEVNPGRRAYLPSDWLFEELWDDPGFVRLMEGPR